MVFTKDDIQTLINVVIANPTQVDLLPRSYATQGFVVFDTAQAKKNKAITIPPLSSGSIWMST